VDVGDGEGEGDEDSWANLGTREVLKARELGFDLLYSRYILLYTRRCLGTIVSAAAPAVAIRHPCSASTCRWSRYTG